VGQTDKERRTLDELAENHARDHPHLARQLTRGQVRDGRIGSARCDRHRPDASQSRGAAVHSARLRFIHERITAPSRDLVERRLARPVDGGTIIPISFAALRFRGHERRRRDVLPLRRAGPQPRRPPRRHSDH
jgi:hypothetical protein